LLSRSTFEPEPRRAPDPAHLTTESLATGIGHLSTFAHALALAGLIAIAGCSSPETHGPDPSATVDELMDPQACSSCHPRHYQEWASSMHAYAADDPLFLAMNRRGQREGQIGTSCLNCHAPMAVRTGATRDGLNLSDLPQQLKGVTCYYCHASDAVQGSHDNPLHLAGDRALRGEIKDPLGNGFHASSYSILHDRDQLESARLCGSCHDIVNGQGVHLERTFQEWQETVFAQAEVGTTCGQCHMDRATALGPAAAVPSAPPRELHSHRFPAIDLPLTPLPDADELSSEVQAFLDSSLQSALCVRGVGGASQIQLVLDNVAAGHRFPSGAAQDRRAWLEVTAYAKGAAIYRTGVVPAGRPLSAAVATELFWLGDCLLDSQDRQVRMFWEANDVESNLLPGQVTFDPSDPRFYETHVVATFPRGTSSIAAFPDRVTLNVRLAPFDLDTFDSLVDSGDLTDSNGVDVESMRAQLATRSVGRELEWTSDSATETFVDHGVPISCISSTNLKAGADKVLATAHTRCGP